VLDFAMAGQNLQICTSDNTNEDVIYKTDEYDVALLFSIVVTGLQRSRSYEKRPFDATYCSL